MGNKIEALRAKLGVSKTKFIVVCVSVLMFIPLLALDLITKVVFEKVLLEKGTIVVLRISFTLNLFIIRDALQDLVLIHSLLISY